MIDTCFLSGQSYKDYRNDGEALNMGKKYLGFL